MKKIILLLLIVLSSCTTGKKRAVEQLMNFNNSGIAQLDSGNYRAAKKSFLHALNSSEIEEEQKSQILRNIAVACFELGQNDSSRYYSTLAYRTVEKGTYHYCINKADVFLLDTVIDSALIFLNRSLDLNGENLEICNSLGMIYLGYYGEGYFDVEKALEYNRKAFMFSPGRMTENLLALSYLANNDYKLAEEHYAKMSKEYSDVVEYKIHLCILKKKLNKEEEFDQLLKELDDIEPSLKQVVMDVVDAN